MAHRVCPWWMGYVLLNPLRRWREDPATMVGPFVREGMMVLEVGPGMGFFTLELARRVGASGRVVAVDVQQRMLARLAKRVARRGLGERVETRLASANGLGIEDLRGAVDLCVAIHVVHEVPDAEVFFRQVGEALQPGGAVLMVEPAGHVSEAELEASLARAARCGLECEQRPVPDCGVRSAVLRRATTPNPR